jgi:AhpC/TSA family
MLPWIAAALAGIWVILSAGAYWAMLQPPDRFGVIMSHTPLPVMIVLPFETLWKQARKGSLAPGDAAPDFRLPALDHGTSVQLSSYRGVRPVVLVFGSYT